MCGAKENTAWERGERKEKKEKIEEDNPLLPTC